VIETPKSKIIRIATALALSIGLSLGALAAEGVAISGEVKNIDEGRAISRSSTLRQEPCPVVVVLHVRMLLHHFGMREILLGCGEQEFMVLLADVAQHETDLLAALGG
jgi:hypothetical protein